MAPSTLIIAALLLITVANAQDPTCSTGVQAAGACCPAECGKCGGPDCGKRGRMLGLKCCIGAVKAMDANCLTSDPPCKITTRDPNFVAISDVPDPRCEDGLRRNRACCPKECSVCGGKGCRARGALIGSSCCPGQIKAGPRGCKDTGAPCALYKKSTPMETQMPMETPMMVETPMPMETPVMMETPMPTEPPMMMETPMPMETPVMMETPMPMETPMMMETPMPMETPMMMETPMPMETPMMMETPMPMETEKPLPKVCTRMRNKFIGGCFCYLIFSGELSVKKAKLYRPFCKEAFGSKKKILSLVFQCRRFVNGQNAPMRVMNIINKINELIPKCVPSLPPIEKRM